MKKILLTAVFVASVIACDKKSETADTPVAETNTTEETLAPTKAEEATVPSAVKLSSPEAQKIADEYVAFINDYVQAYKAGDATKIQELVTKQQEWGTKLTTEMAKMSPEDVKVLSEYMQKAAEEMLAAAMPAKK